MSLVLHSEELARCHAEVIAGLQEVLQPDRLEVLGGLALIATVGQGMSHRVGVAGTLFSALQQANVQHSHDGIRARPRLTSLWA